MIRILALAAAIAVAAPAAQALTQLQQGVQSDLRTYGFGDVDVTTLSSGQLAQIHAIANFQGREGGRRSLIRSTLGELGTLKGLFGLN